MSKKRNVYDPEAQKPKTTPPLRVGITFPDKGTKEQALWANGLVQNAIFMYRTLALIPGVKPFVLGSFQLAREFDLEHTTNGPGYLDVVIEVATKLDPASATAFRAGGGRIVHHVPGNTMFLNLEHAALGSTTPDIPYGGYDAVWILPHVFATNVGYYSAMYRCPVEQAPMMWAPDFMDKDWPVYQPGLARKVVAAFEPSMSVVKTPHIPLLIVDRCNKLDPEQGPIIDCLKLYGAAEKAKNSISFRSLMNALSVQSSTDLEQRVPARLAFQGLSCVLAHSFENGLNYNWWEALYAGYPLLHNSEFVKAGYKYDSWSVYDAADLLHNVLRKHDEPEIRGQYELAAKQFLATMNPVVVAPYYAQLLSKVARRQL